MVCFAVATSTYGGWNSDKACINSCGWRGFRRWWWWWWWRLIKAVRVFTNGASRFISLQATSCSRVCLGWSGAKRIWVQQLVEVCWKVCLLSSVREQRNMIYWFMVVLYIIPSFHGFSWMNLDISGWIRGNLSPLSLIPYTAYAFSLCLIVYINHFSSLSPLFLVCLKWGFQVLQIISQNEKKKKKKERKKNEGCTCICILLIAIVMNSALWKPMLNMQWDIQRRL